MKTIPISATPSQTLNVTLGDAQCLINIYEKSTGVYMDLTVDGAVIMTGVICRDRVRIVRYTYLGFVGDLSFYDTEGATDPTHSGFGTRYQLLYLSPGEF